MTTIPVPDVSSLSYGSGVAAFLNNLCAAVAVGRDGAADVFDRRDWTFTGSGRYLDRVAAVRNSDGVSRDISHRVCFVTRGSPLWEPISVPPAYAAIPEGERLHWRSTKAMVGDRFRLTSDASYYGGQCFPVGTEVVMAGYKTTTDLVNGHLVIVFESIARFPDGTYRHLPIDAEALQHGE